MFSAYRHWRDAIQPAKRAGILSSKFRSMLYCPHWAGFMTTSYIPQARAIKAWNPGLLLTTTDSRQLAIAGPLVCWQLHKQNADQLTPTNCNLSCFL